MPMINQPTEKTDSDNYNNKYHVDIIKMIRNNNTAAGIESLKEYDTYFMLDYFDLLFHKSLTGDNKIYKEFWNIRDSYEKKDIVYKAAYKTLSLYTKSDSENNEIFKIPDNNGADFLSATPFLGIIQITLVYTTFPEEFNVETTLSAWKDDIIEHLRNNMDEGDDETFYEMYRSSTSGDFCLVVKSDSIESIHKIAALINRLVIPYNEDNFEFNTYTNVGIACQVNNDGEFLTFHDDTIRKNQKCEFALRFTADHDFADCFLRKNRQASEKDHTVKLMEGLFGRYDFLLQISMDEFAQIYATLCASKIDEKNAKILKFEDDENISWIEYLKKGIIENKIQIINERALVYLSDTLFTPRELRDVPASAHQQLKETENQLKETENRLKETVKDTWKTLKEKMSDFLAMENIFLEERRVFIDIGRELSELINTYVPQGIESDSQVNWQMLISDLKVAFSCIEKWKDSYKECKNISECKDMRIHFLDDLRLVTDAIHRHYKFLQNVNAQTWQSPLYEIQTQLDAEKMMIAYREFLFEYFYDYKKHYANTDDTRPMIYPILYPDMSIDIACAMAVFQDTEGLDERLLICRVPSFEYYGRMFDMIPWILHEASHSIRTYCRPERNKYLIYIVMKNVFSQVLYKFLNKYSNDYGYHQLGLLENDILECIVNTAVEEFREFCSQGKEDLNSFKINDLETKLLKYLEQIFDQNIKQMDKGEDTVNIKSIQAVLFHYLSTLGQLHKNKKEPKNIASLVEKSADHTDALFRLLRIIHNIYYKKITGKNSEGNQWELIKQDIDELEIKLETEQALLKDSDISPDAIRDYSFTMRELNRLYGAWHKRRKDTGSNELRNELWKKSVPDIRKNIKEGFKHYKGFTELYRIFNMEFNSEEDTDYTNIQKIEQDFNILLQEEVRALVMREVTIYRESYADLYMAAALGFDTFGYCRQISQTTSDASKENTMQWASAVNVNRFRAVSAVLLAKEEGYKKKNDNLYIPMNSLLDKGNIYCRATLECIQHSISSKAEKEPQLKDKQEAIKDFFEALHQNINTIFEFFKQDTPVKDALEYSLLTVYLDPDAEINAENPEVIENYNNAVKTFKPIEEVLQDYRYVIYRIKCFISLLDLIGKNGQLIIKETEYEHLSGLYEDHFQNCRKIREEEACKIVTEYYNTPRSPRTKTAEIMLEDTIQFIETYYYRNRFIIMSSPDVKREVKGEVNLNE